MKKNKFPKDARVAYFGTSEFAVYVFDELKNAGIEPAVIVTPPDKPAGRGLAMSESPAKTWAIKHEIGVLQPEKLTIADEQMSFILNSEWDVFIVASFGKLIPLEVLRIPRYGTLNVHPSLLPKFRGPSPIESQILSDVRETGVTVMLLDEEMDHGPVVAQASITLEEWPMRASLLEELLGREGGALLSETLPDWLEEGMMSSDPYEVSDGVVFEDRKPKLTAEPQDHANATFTKKVEKSDGLLNVSDDAYQNYLKFCAYDLWPGTYFMHKTGGKEIRVKVTGASFADGAFVIEKVIPEGKREMDYQSFLRGYAS